VRLSRRPGPESAARKALVRAREGRWLSRVRPEPEGLELPPGRLAFQLVVPTPPRTISRRPRNRRAVADNRNEVNSNGESNEEAPTVVDRRRAYVEGAGTGENENKRGCSQAQAHRGRNAAKGQRARGETGGGAAEKESLTAAVRPVAEASVKTLDEKRHGLGRCLRVCATNVTHTGGDMLKPNPNWAIEIARMLNPAWAGEIEEKLQQRRERLRVLLGPTVTKLRQEMEHLAESMAKAGDHALAEELRQAADRLVAELGGGAC
jgi:hypothetical protein